MDTLLEGLAVGFILYWLLYSSSQPKFWLRLREWWWLVGPKAWEGKPLSCDLCMAFWSSTAVTIWIAGWWIAGRLNLRSTCTNCTLQPEVFILFLAGALTELFARAAVALLLARALERINTIYLSKSD